MPMSFPLLRAPIGFYVQVEVPDLLILDEPLAGLGMKMFLPCHFYMISSLTLGALWFTI